MRPHDKVAGGAYEVLRFLGNSRSADVYEARQASLDRSVALKILRAGVEQDEESRRHFLAQAQLSARLHHPHICPIFEASLLEDGRLFMAMELLAGEDLEMLLYREQRLPLERTLKIMAQVCLALGAAHAAGVLHGNLKPRNIHVEQLHSLPDFVRVRDFGFGTEQPGLIGTPRYVSPGCISGQRQTERSDLYAVGTILYETLTGQPPFSEADGFMSALKARLDEDAPNLCTRYPELEVPSSLGRLIGQCLARDPHERPPSAGWLADRLVEELATLRR